MNVLRYCCGLLICTLFIGLNPASGQTLTLRNGSVVEGLFMGGTQESIIMQVAGETRVYDLADVESLSFPNMAPPPAPVRSAAPTTVTVIVPAGTRILVSIDGTIETGRSRSGDRFTATLQGSIMAGDYMLVPKGTRFYGKVVESVKAGRIAGIASLQLTLTDVEIEGRLRPVITDAFGMKGSRSGTLKKIAAGMAVGAIASGSSGLNEGAAVGAAAAIMTRGNQIQIPQGALIEFRTLYERTIIIEN